MVRMITNIPNKNIRTIRYHSFMFLSGEDN